MMLKLGRKWHTNRLEIRAMKVGRIRTEPLPGPEPVKRRNEPPEMVGPKALAEAVVVQAAWDALGKTCASEGRRTEAIQWLMDPRVGAGKWWIEQVLQLDYEALLEQLHIRKEHK